MSWSVARLCHLNYCLLLACALLLSSRTNKIDREGTVESHLLPTSCSFIDILSSVEYHQLPSTAAATSQLRYQWMFDSFIDGYQSIGKWFLSYLSTNPICIQLSHASHEDTYPCLIRENERRRSRNLIYISIYFSFSVCLGAIIIRFVCFAEQVNMYVCATVCVCVRVFIVIKGVFVMKRKWITKRKSFDACISVLMYFIKVVC